jgi:hypothetical protein
MATELVAIPSESVAAVTARWNNYMTALRGGIGVLITTTRGNLQTFALNPCSMELGRDPTAPEGWAFKAQALKTDGTPYLKNGEPVFDTADIYPGVRRQPDGSLMLEYPEAE